MNIENCKIDNLKAKLLLHSCCAPCLTAVNGKIDADFDISILWYNPNIEPLEEHNKRLSVLQNFADETAIQLNNYKYDYREENDKWHEAIAGFENEPEGGKRCEKCIEFRLQRTKELSEKYDLFTTTLSVSPHKNAKFINEFGKKLSPKYLKSDFKKENGYLRSIELSKEYELYRQNYCGCLYSTKY
ncbi:MAG: epoxyqueuosine reductase QueH [Patescibacteria group bacterium]